MAFSVTNTFTGQTSLSAAELDANFADIVNLVSGGLTSTHLAAAAGITNAQLATSSYEIVLSFSLHGTQINQAVTADLIIGAPPYYSSPMTYNIRSIAQMFILDTGAPGAGDHLIGTIEYGNSVDGWGTTIYAGVDVGAADNQSFLTPLVTSTITTAAARPSFFRFNVTQLGANYAAGDSFCLSILLQHALR